MGTLSLRTHGDSCMAAMERQFLKDTKFKVCVFNHGPLVRLRDLPGLKWCGFDLEIIAENRSVLVLSFTRLGLRRLSKQDPHRTLIQSAVYLQSDHQTDG